LKKWKGKVKKTGNVVYNGDSDEDEDVLEFGKGNFDGKEGEIRVTIGEGNENNKKENNNNRQPFLIKSDGLLTIAAWLYPVDRNRVGSGIQIRDTDGLFGSSISITKDSKFGFYVQDSNGKFRGPQTNQIIKENSWSHIAGVAEDECLAIYLNGVLENKVCDKQGFQKLVNSGVIDILIGHYDTSKHSSFYHGSIADVRVYSRALNEEEIKSVMYSSFNLPINE